MHRKITECFFFALKVGLKGEFLKIYTTEDNGKAEWIDLTLDDIPSTFTWYKVNLIAYGVKTLKTVVWNMDKILSADFAFVID